VIFAMSRPSPGLRYRLSEIAMNFGITSKRYVESAGEERASQHPIGTGPFKFSEARHGERISFVRSSPHWRVNPSLERITLRAVPDDGVRLRMLLSGEGDLCVIGFDDIAPVRQAGRQVLSAKNLVGCTIHLQGQYLEPRYPASRTPPWAQRDASLALAVRRALSLTIDRNAIVEHILGGNGAAEGAVVGGFFPSNPGFDPNARVDPYDPDRARALLARAGYPDPSAIQFTVDLAPVPSRAWSGSITEAAAQQWAEFGFGVTTQRSDFAALQNRIIGRQATEAWCYPTPLFDDGAELLAFYTRSTDRLSWTGESVELDTLMAAALNAVGPEAVVQTRQRLFAYLYENVPALCVCYADYLYGATPSFRWQMPKGVVLSNLEYASFA
jgi:ABC-type transport system substrate-binding protein